MTIVRKSTQRYTHRAFRRMVGRLRGNESYNLVSEFCQECGRLGPWRHPHLCGECLLAYELSIGKDAA